MSETKKSILLVDDHDLILQGIKYIVDQIPEINQLCTASSAEDVSQTSSSWLVSYSTAST